MIPPSAVFEIAPANVLHGAVRLHGFASSPTPDTQVRVAWPKADDGMTSASSARTGSSSSIRRRLLGASTVLAGIRAALMSLSKFFVIRPGIGVAAPDAPVREEENRPGTPEVNPS